MARAAGSQKDRDEVSTVRVIFYRHRGKSWWKKERRKEEREEVEVRQQSDESEAG
jgi:hypothetical protein